MWRKLFSLPSRSSKNEHLLACYEKKLIAAQQRFEAGDYFSSRQLSKQIFEMLLAQCQDGFAGPRQIILFTGCASLFATSTWHCGQRDNCMAVIKTTCDKLRAGWKQSHQPQARQSFYCHCIDALQRTAKELADTPNIVVLH